MTHLNQRELANSVITPAADIETIPVYSYTVWIRQLSYTQLTDELSRHREYLNSVIDKICHEYLMSFLMNSYTMWVIWNKQLSMSSTFLPSSYNGGMPCGVTGYIHWHLYNLTKTGNAPF